MALFPWSPSPYWYGMEYPYRARGPFYDLERMVEQIDGLTRRMMVPFAELGDSHLLETSAGESRVVNDDKKYQVSLDVRHFKPEELEVKTIKDCLVIHGKHEANRDEHGFIKREFTRSYWLPKGVKGEDFKSRLSADGVLTVEAPKLAIDQSNERKIAIEHAK